MTYFTTLTQPRFCFIRGSFAETAPQLRRPDSDIDIICSENFTEQEIRLLLKQKYPDLPSDVKLDISHKTPKNGVINFKHSYWSPGPYIELTNGSGPGNLFHKVKVKNIPLPMDFINTLRDPNKQCFKSYLLMTPKIDITPTRPTIRVLPDSYMNAINRHYGLHHYVNAITGLPEERILKQLYRRNWQINKKCSEDFKKIILMPQFQLVLGSSHQLSYDHFLQKCLAE
jgi:hypothetical protein